MNLVVGLVQNICDIVGDVTCKEKIFINLSSFQFQDIFYIRDEKWVLLISKTTPDGLTLLKKMGYRTCMPIGNTW